MVMKYCRFTEDVIHMEEKIWEKDKVYLVTAEDDEYYYFGTPILNGISKVHEGTKFIKATIEDDEREDKNK